ncbi:pentapeptide repeat-containing protein [Nodularia spumigena CS-586/05]|uniref:pentapeptide repeat-containing protein n=1 Tax=Nodularia spumigena TaxID=70799 RepID=UPI0023305AA7|nr:pentapeptide repeat-containing protein [Nodularia spumigena]MDB9343746.1 pentapeptide repeat-containing protein [Nodularia spumigena CS-588/06]MDB9368353.1 pentapeptide repeat-containing protein [Nodularia spumigena CS-586/05]
MANEEHLAILKQGVEVWNEWRSENPDLEVDLIDADLISADLINANLTDANLSGANLSGSNLSNADLFSANLIAASLSNANLSNAKLGGSNLSRANLISSDLIDAHLFFANLSAADLSEANLTNADLQGSDLRWANLSNADLSEAILSGSDLFSANLSAANLSGANLSGSNVMDTNFDNATLTGAYIKDWCVNSDTKLDKVFCEYVYLSYEYLYEDREKQESRRPLEGKFLPGEFASLYKKIIENTDLILRKTPENANIANNQGVQFNFNNKTHTWERLTFRSKTEIKIAEALDRAGTLFLPNCLARLNTPNGRANKEADFLICYNGKWGILEVDGPYHTPERRVEEQERERIFRRHGIKVVERFDSSRCYENPDEVVQEFFKMLEIGYS